MNAILVSVDYSDLLAVTLPWNRHHFDRVMVVTAPGDSAAEVATANGASAHVTDAFYRGGAAFNKWAALEEGLDALGRVGWLCVMDADVLWPKAAPLDFVKGRLYSPLRHMSPAPDFDETNWSRYPVHRNINEHAGYSQVFWAGDKALGPPPWHEVDWKHAGGADSFFQQKWPTAYKRRPSWRCLHIGEAGANWMGRATTRLDGTVPEGAEARRAALLRMFLARRRGGGFTGEKLN